MPSLFHAGKANNDSNGVGWGSLMRGWADNYKCTHQRGKWEEGFFADRA